MERIKTPETRTYRDGDFIVEIVKTELRGETVFEGWLSAPDYGIKELIFGQPIEQPDGTRYDWGLAEQVVKAILKEFEDCYREEHMDD